MSRKAAKSQRTRDESNERRKKKLRLNVLARNKISQYRLQIIHNPRDPMFYKRFIEIDKKPKLMIRKLQVCQ